jgi:hypothetical protein
MVSSDPGLVNESGDAGAALQYNRNSGCVLDAADNAGRGQLGANTAIADLRDTA